MSIRDRAREVAGRLSVAALARVSGELGGRGLVTAEQVDRLLQHASRKRLIDIDTLALLERDARAGNYPQTDRRYGQTHPALLAFTPWTGDVEPDVDAGPFGTKVSRAFVGLKPRATTETHPPGLPSVDNEIFEWIDLAQAVLDARGSFSMIELGAGYGRWLVRGARLAKAYRQLDVRLRAVEAEPSHFRMLQEHVRRNGLRDDEVQLIHAAISDQPGEVRFAAGDAEAWWGQSILHPDLEFTPAETTTVRAVTLADVLERGEHVDYVDMDIQGEEGRVVESSVDLLSACVRQLHVATHSDEVAEQVYRALEAAGWWCGRCYPPHAVVDTELGPIRFVDGVQSWWNPARLAPHQARER